MNSCCDKETEADAIYCQICGKPLKSCAACGVLAGSEASFCRRCGRPLIAAAEAAGERTHAAPKAGSPPSDPGIDSDVDFSTSVRASAKRVVPMTQGRGPHRRARAAVYVTIALAFAGLLALVLDTWRGTRTLSSRQPEQIEELKKWSAEMLENRRRATTAEIADAAAKTKDDLRGEVMADLTKFEARIEQNVPDLVSKQIAAAVPPIRNKDRRRITTASLQELLPMLPKGRDHDAVARTINVVNGEKPRGERRLESANHESGRRRTR